MEANLNLLFTHPFRLMICGDSGMCLRRRQLREDINILFFQGLAKVI